MKKILRSPWGVGVLVLIAIYCVYQNLVPRKKSSSDMISPLSAQVGTIQAALDQARQLTGALNSHPLAEGVQTNLKADVRDPSDDFKVKKNYRAWNVTFPRDPFFSENAPEAVEDPAPADAPAEAGAQENGGPPRLQLKAIFGDAANLSALLDEKVVQKGDVVSGWQVSEIVSDAVLLSNGSQSYRLKLSGAGNGLNE